MHKLGKVIRELEKRGEYELAAELKIAYWKGSYWRRKGAGMYEKFSGDDRIDIFAFGKVESQRKNAWGTYTICLGHKAGASLFARDECTRGEYTGNVGRPGDHDSDVQTAAENIYRYKYR